MICEEVKDIDKADVHYTLTQLRFKMIKIKDKNHTLKKVVFFAAR